MLILALLFLVCLVGAVFMWDVLTSGGPAARFREMEQQRIAVVEKFLREFDWGRR